MGGNLVISHWEGGAGSQISLRLDSIGTRWVCSSGFDQEGDVAALSETRDKVFRVRTLRLIYEISATHGGV